MALPKNQFHHGHPQRMPQEPQRPGRSNTQRGWGTGERLGRGQALLMSCRSRWTRAVDFQLASCWNALRMYIGCEFSCHPCRALYRGPTPVIGGRPSNPSQQMNSAQMLHRTQTTERSVFASRSGKAVSLAPDSCLTVHSCPGFHSFQLFDTYRVAVPNYSLISWGAGQKGSHMITPSSI